MVAITSTALWTGIAALIAVITVFTARGFVVSRDMTTVFLHFVAGVMIGVVLMAAVWITVPQFT